MTGSEDSPSSRPISVAELLAKNDRLGAPPVGGRRRRRRGNADAVTVAELTGEIPVVEDDTPPPPAEPDLEQPVEQDRERRDESPAPEPDATALQPETDTAAPAPEPEADTAEADYAAHLEARAADDAPVEFTPRRRRSPFRPAAFRRTAAGSGAEQMSPDPVEDDVFDSPIDLADPPETEHDTDLAESHDVSAAEVEDADDADAQPSYLRSTHDPLFGGPTSDAVSTRPRRGPGPEDIDLDDEDLDEDEEDLELDEYGAEAGAPGRLSLILRGAWVVVQCILAVAFGAGLFIAFDRLWEWNSIIALILGMLVILGLVAGVRVVRKTEDIASTMIAVVVGALVTFGPLALQLQAN